MNAHASVPAAGPAATTDTPMLVAENVDLFYGAAQALYGVSLTARAGEVTALMGRNGVGKTSFLRAVVGEQPIAGGAIALNGVTLGRMAPHDRARLGIGYVPQGRDIFPLLTVKENLETGYAPLKHADRSIPPDVFDLFPVLADMLKRRGGDLSGGQQQQLAIARALVTRPKLLVLDEPTEGIQPSIIKDIGRAITWLRQKGDMAILLVEQYFDFVHELADRFAVMDRGHIILAGTREEMDPDRVRRHLTV
jgi:urea transport system ATP-binding protein